MQMVDDGQMCRYANVRMMVSRALPLIEAVQVWASKISAAFTLINC